MKPLDHVRLVIDYKGLPAETEGTIVHAYDDGTYEVEYFDNSALTIAVFPTPADVLEEVDEE
ncbi:DUF4926 domain-containing protein [Dialister hominis]|uniref:DUF4926 domain-containing protein n=1 Tax=Dialister hominis TaxID=2582419 RepID=UPI0024C75435|nr:DUF4926 domain-containing protein [uncultured Dialister sp.]UYJ17578.1 MAG: DUF4926 domain-containing protein [Veillonellaceae bacterium]HJI73077.1 DUF4926 domain-containing protein [Veillonellaceae bacterium]